MSITQDATSGRYCPADAAEWAELLAGTTIPVPDACWPFQETSSFFFDTIGTEHMTALNPFQYAQAVSGWSRVGWTTQDAAGYYVGTAGNWGGTESTLQLGFVASAVPSAERTLMYSNNCKINMTSGGLYEACTFGSNTGPSRLAPGTGVRPVLLKTDVTAGTVRGYDDVETFGSGPNSGSNKLYYGGVIQTDADATYVYGAAWRGANAELTDFESRLLIDLLWNGPLATRTITQDGTSGWYFPASPAEWALLLAGTGIEGPDACWQCQEAAGDLFDGIGPWTLTKFNGPSYNQALSGFARTAVQMNSTNDCFYSFASGIGDINARSHMMLALIEIGGASTNETRAMWLGNDSAGRRDADVFANTAYRAAGVGLTTTTGASNPGTTPHLVLLQVDLANSANVLQTDQETIQPAFVTPGGVNNYLGLGFDAHRSDTILLRHGFAGLWLESRAEIDSTARATLIDRIMNGPPSTGLARVLSSQALVSGVLSSPVLGGN